MRSQFQLPEGKLYFNGNSLGPLPHIVAARLSQVVTEQWGEQLVAGWNDAGWIEMPHRLGDRVGQLIGAKAGQTLVCDSTSINVFKLLMTALARHPERDTILLEADGFPTDNYIAQGIAQILPRLKIQFVSASQMAQRFDASVAAAVINHVNYRSGARVDMPRTQASAKEFDIPVVWDLAHSAGALPINLDADGIEYAVGCSYKFLNAGPGAPAFLYVAANCQPNAKVALSGWLGHAQAFQFAQQYEPAEGINRFQVGTPAILSMSALEASLSLFESVDMEALWASSCELFDRFDEQLVGRPELQDFQLLTPRSPDERGSQISLLHAQAYPISRALAAHGVVVDYREPAVLRFGLTPLYTRPEDVDAAITILSQIMREELWAESRFQHRKAVT